LHVSYIWSKKIIRKHSQMTGTPYHHYIQDNSHPTTLYNELIAWQIQQFIMAESRHDSLIQNETKNNEK
ncbi:hypothetical protein JW979_05105, partial [bacterium]|nr:hypothetical protein [candidate division CSSED10-310 bacterium]